MIPLEWIRIVPIDQLQPGDLAFLVGDFRKRLLVGELDGLVVATCPDDPKPDLFQIQMVDGHALVFRDWEVEVDHTTLSPSSHLQDKIGSLLIAEGTLSILCLGKGGMGYRALPLRNGGTETAGKQYCLRVWRIFKSNGDEKVELCNRAAWEALA